MIETPARPESTAAPDSTQSIRRQLIMASLFPLVAFGLLMVLVITAALQNIALKFILERNTALAQTYALTITENLQGKMGMLQVVSSEVGDVQANGDLNRFLPALKNIQGDVLLVESNGTAIAALPAQSPYLKVDFSNIPGFRAAVDGHQPVFSAFDKDLLSNSPLVIAVPYPIVGKIQRVLLAVLPAGPAGWFQNIWAGSAVSGRISLINQTGNIIVQAGKNFSSHLDPEFLSNSPQSILTQETPSGEQMVVSVAPLSIGGWRLIFEQPWFSIFSPAVNYEWTLAALLVVGILLSMIMLSVSVGRVIRPLANLANSANQLGPGSVFRPLPEEGPIEVRSLFRAFNQMVIRLAEQQASLRQYAEKALLSQEEERLRISHELHDETVQDLVGLVQRVDLCRSELDKDPALAHKRLDELGALAEQALDDLRRISNALRPYILQDLGLPTAIRSLCDDLSQKMPYAQVECVLPVEQRRLASGIELAVFRVAQEAISNIRRHALDATAIRVVLEISEDSVRLNVQDNGPGFQVPDVRELIRAGHLGLAGMYERARLFNGELSINSNPGAGTKVILCLKCRDGWMENF